MLFRSRDDLFLALDAMLQVGTKERLRLAHGIAVRRIQDCIVTREEFAYGCEVVGHVAVGRRHHRRAPSHDVVAGEECVFFIEVNAEMVRRVAGLFLAQRERLFI